MKSFSKLTEGLESEKCFKITCEVELVIKAGNEGEAGYIADAELGSIENHTSFNIKNISEISKDEYKQLTLTESYASEINALSKDMSPTEKIIKVYNDEFGSRVTTETEKMEFYHRMREAGFDGLIIMDTLQGMGVFTN